MVDLLVVLAYLGSGGLIVGAAAGMFVRQRRHPWRMVGALGAVGTLGWIGFWIWWSSRACGPNCVTDASFLLTDSPFQVLGYLIGATAVLRLSGR